MIIIFTIITFIIFIIFFHDDLESSEQSPALEEKNTQVKDRPGLVSVPPTEPITADQEKQRTAERRASITWGVSWCCGHYCLLAFVLWCGYCSMSFQSFVLRHWCPQHQETTITCQQVILVSGKEITREMVVFDPDVGKLICSKILKNISDRAIVVDMNKAGIGGFFLFL